MLKADGISSVETYGGKYNFQNSTLEVDHGTSHISIVDADRNAVSMTTTINTGFGSFVYSASTGVLLNNEMDDFSRPDRPNVYGLHPSGMLSLLCKSQSKVVCSNQIQYLK